MHTHNICMYRVHTFFRFRGVEFQSGRTAAAGHAAVSASADPAAAATDKFAAAVVVLGLNHHRAVIAVRVHGDGCVDGGELQVLRGVPAVRRHEIIAVGLVRRVRVHLHHDDGRVGDDARVYRTNSTTGCVTYTYAYADAFFRVYRYSRVGIIPMHVRNVYACLQVCALQERTIRAV